MYRGPEARRPPGERTCRARHASEQRARKRLRPAVPDTPPLFPDSSALDASGQLTAGRHGAVEGQACHFGRPGRRSWRWAGSRLRASEVVPGPPTQLAWHPEGWRGRPGGGGWEAEAGGRVAFGCPSLADWETEAHGGFGSHFSPASAPAPSPS